MTRGPGGQVPLPPPDLGSRSLPFRRIPAGTSVLRIHRRAWGALHFSPGPGKPPRSRFDSGSGRFGVLYASEAFAVCFAESLLREPTLGFVRRREIEACAVTALRISADTDLVDLTGPGLSRLGLDARLVSGPYDACGAWADAFHDHPSAPAGILYPSRFDPSGTCLALFDRIAPELIVVGDPVPLLDLPREVAAILDRYGKALSPE